MKVRIEIDTDNDAFQVDCCAEVARCIAELAKRLPRCYPNAGRSLTPGDTLRLFDLNGNTVGRFTVED